MMSNDSEKLLRARSKLRKKRKTKVVSKLTLQEQHIQQLKNDGYSVSSEFLLPKYATLVSRMLRGRADIKSMLSIFKDFSQDAILSDKIESVFKLSSPEKYLITLKGASFKGAKFPGEMSFMVCAVGSNSTALHLHDSDGRTYVIKAGSLVFGAVIRCEKLPADIRKWDKLWVNSLLGSRYKLGKYGDMSNKGSVSKLISKGVRAMPKLMKINRTPSKKQRLPVKKKSKPKGSVPELYGNNPDVDTKLYTY